MKRNQANFNCSAPQQNSAFKERRWNFTFLLQIKFSVKIHCEFSSKELGVFSERFGNPHKFSRLFLKYPQSLIASEVSFLFCEYSRCFKFWAFPVFCLFLQMERNSNFFEGEPFDETWTTWESEQNYCLFFTAAEQCRSGEKKWNFLNGPRPDIRSNICKLLCLDCKNGKSKISLKINFLNNFLWW